MNDEAVVSLQLFVQAGWLQHMRKKSEKCCGMSVISGEFGKCCGQGLTAKIYDTRYEECCRSKSSAILYSPKLEICCDSKTYDSNEVKFRVSRKGTHCYRV